MRSSVVLPQPEGPSKAISSPDWMSSDTSRSAWKSPNCLLTLRISMLMMLLSFRARRPSAAPAAPRPPAFISRSWRHSTTDLITSVTSASSASSEATAKAATDWYSL